MNEIERLKKAVEQAERGGNFDTIHHERLAKLSKKSKKKIPVDTVKTFTKEKDDG